MLIRFSAENFRSIRDEIELNLSAINYYKEHNDELITSELPGLAKVNYLRAAAIYGPNASGKTSLFKALERMKHIIVRSPQVSSDALLPFEPFELDAESRKLPSRFFVAFVADGIRFEYSFSYNRHEITSESLRAFPKSQAQTWFTRKGNLLAIEIKDSEYLKISKPVRDMLNSNQLLFPLLANFQNMLSSRQLVPVFKWFKNDLTLLSRAPMEDNPFPISGEILYGTTGTDYQRSFIQKMLQKADIGITQAEIIVEKMSDDFYKSILAVSPNIEGKEAEQEMKSVVMSHKSGEVELKLPLSEESGGTVQLFGMSGLIAAALERGTPLFVDEIDASLHPSLVREIVKVFLNPKSNPSGAQLIFTAHNPSLLMDDLLRRDQVWFMKKNKAGYSSLYPLSEFHPRKDESLAMGFLAGRYYSTPVVQECFGLCEQNAGGGTEHVAK